VFLSCFVSAVAVPNSNKRLITLKLRVSKGCLLYLDMMPNVVYRMKIAIGLDSGCCYGKELTLCLLRPYVSIAKSMKTASLGLLEVPVVRVNAGGDAPRTPPLLVTSRAIPPFFVFLQKVFWRISGKIFLAS